MFRLAVGRVDCKASQCLVGTYQCLDRRRCQEASDSTVEVSRSRGLKRNQLRLEVGVVFQKLPLAGEARPPDQPIFARETLGTRMIETPQS